MGIEFNSDANSEVSFSGPDVKEEESRDNLHNEILGVSTEKYEQLQVELEECRNRIEELKLHHDEEKAGKEQTLKVLAAYVKQTRDERQQYVQQINSLEIIVMMLKLKAKNSANHASRLEERLQELKTENEQLQSHCDFMMNILIEGDYEMDTEQRNKVASSKNSTVSRNTAVKPYSSHSEQVNTSTKSNTRLDSTNHTQPSLGTNPSVPPINFETQPNFNFLNQTPTQGQPFRFAADTSDTGVVRLKELKKKEKC